MQGTCLACLEPFMYLNACMVCQFTWHCCIKASWLCCSRDNSSKFRVWMQQMWKGLTTGYERMPVRGERQCWSWQLQVVLDHQGIACNSSQDGWRPHTMQHEAERNTCD
jgi:hypothetical protein